MEEKIGIWIDKKQAFVIKLSDLASNVIKIDSPIESFNPKGGYGGKTPYGPVDAVKEKAYLAREKKKKKEFFDLILKEMGNIKYVFVFGPAQMKFELKKYLDDKHGFSPEILMCETADSMTRNQMIAEVRDAFHHV